MLIGGRISPAVKNLLIVNVGVFMLTEILNAPVSRYFGLVPDLFWNGFVWQTVTYMFLHGGFGHLFWNMFALWMFGTALEHEWGTKKFVTYYFVTGIGAGLLSAIVDPGSYIPIVGASGAIYGLLLGFGMTYPNQPIFLYFLFPIKAKYFVMIFGAIELYSQLSLPNSGVAHMAHLGGILIGLIYLKKDIILKKTLAGVKENNSSQNLRVVFDKEKEMELLRNEVDELLDKVNREGLDKLTPKEIHRLKQASRKLREWDKQK